MGCHCTYTKREWLMLVTLASLSLGSSLCASLQAPFYPHEAEEKGAKATEYGLVFGIFELTAFISCPLFGKYMGVLGPSRVLKTGTMVAGISLILFGIFEALGSACVVTSSMSIMVTMFSETFGRVYTVIEIFQGLGFMVGPTVGGYLFEAGGFMCPFAVVGTFVIFNGFLVFFGLPKIEKDLERHKVGIIAVIRLLPILLDVFTMIVQAATLGFLAATLEPHLRQFKLGPLAIGGMFAISSVFYMGISPIIGFLCDKKWDTKKMILLGSIINIIDILMIGPAPFTPLEANLWLIGFGLVLNGVALALMFVPAFVDAITSAVKYGLPDDIATYALVSGIYTSSFALGSFIGPSVGGFLYDMVGFRIGTIFLISMHVLLIIAHIAWFLCIKKKYDANNIKIELNVEGDAATGAAGAGANPVP